MRLPLALVVLLIGNWPVRGAERQIDFFAPLVPPRSFQVMVHGDLARRDIARCIEDALEWVEFDVRLTRDNQHVLFPDERLDDRTNGSGPLKEHTLAELEKLDAGRWFAPRFAGARILRLDECLALAKNHLNVCLDCRDVDPQLLVRQIKDAGMESQVIVRGSRDELQRVRALSGGKIAIMPRWRPEDGFSGWLDELRPDVVEIEAEQVTPDVCRELHARGIRVLADARGDADQPAGWEKALAAGAEVVKTELPEELVVHVLWGRMQTRPVRFASHRGASRYAPENTLAAFDKAYRLGADFVEFDVRPTSDGKYYLLHDSRLDRTTNHQGPIREATSAVVDALDAGSWFGRPFAGAHVPSLEAFLASVPAGVSLYFDAKDIPPAELAAALEQHGLAERTVVYQDAGYLEQLRAIDPRIRRMPPARSAEQVTKLAATLQPYAVDTPWPMVSKAYIDHCHAAGIQVFADAPFVVDVAGYRRAIEAGIDLIQTDHPLRLWRAMELVAADRAEAKAAP